MVTVLKELDLFKETRGMDYCQSLDLLAISCDNQVLFVKSIMSQSAPFDKTSDSIVTEHGSPTLSKFNIVAKNNQQYEAPSHIVVADNDGPIDVFDLQTKHLVRSYLEHSSRVTGLSWYDSQSYVSSSADGTVRLYRLTDRHSHCILNLYAGTCGVNVSFFSSHLFAFGTTKGKFYIYDTRNTSTPYLEAKGHSKTISNTAFISDFELLTVGIDNTAKLWDLQRTVCTKNYKDILHHKCFVGLDSCHDYIALGGEDSCVRIFHKDDTQCIASRKLSSSTSFVCGCALTSSDNGLQLIATGNQGYLALLELKLRQ